MYVGIEYCDHHHYIWTWENVIWLVAGMIQSIMLRIIYDEIVITIKGLSYVMKII